MELEELEGEIPCAVCGSKLGVTVIIGDGHCVDISDKYEIDYSYKRTIHFCKHPFREVGRATIVRVSDNHTVVFHGEIIIPLEFL